MSVPHRHRLHYFRWLGALALLAFALHALIPTGFMVARVDGHAELVMCPSGLYHVHGVDPAADTLAMAGMHHGALMHHGPGVDHSGHAALAAQQCPFALASGAALTAQVRSPAEPYFVFLRPLRADVVTSVPADPPLRHRAPRGPPALA